MGLALLAIQASGLGGIMVFGALGLWGQGISALMCCGGFRESRLWV